MLTTLAFISNYIDVQMSLLPRVQSIANFSSDVEVAKNNASMVLACFLVVWITIHFFINASVVKYLNPTN